MIASEIMTGNPRTIRPTDTLRDALDALQEMQIRHLPVVDESGNLVGMVSDRDLGPLMKPFVEGSEGERLAAPLAERRIAELMSSDVVSVDADEDVRTVIDAMLAERIGAVPVVDGDGAVAGIISYVDVLRVLGSAAGED